MLATSTSSGFIASRVISFAILLEIEDLLLILESQREKHLLSFRKFVLLSLKACVEEYLVCLQKKKNSALFCFLVF